MRARLIFLLTVGLAFAACGGGSSEESFNSQDEPPPTSTPPPSHYISAAGTITAPSGTSAEAFTVVALGRESTVDSAGGFSAFVRPESISLIVASRENRPFALTRVVVAHTDSVDDTVDIDATTTAISMVFVSPHILTQDPVEATRVLAVIENDVTIPALADAIVDAFGDDAPFQNASLRTAYINALEAVASRLSAVSVPNSANNRNNDNAMAVLRLPKRSSTQILAAQQFTATPIAIDMVLTDIDIISRDNEYLLQPSSSFGTPVDWLVEVGEVDVSRIYTHEFGDLAADRYTVYPRVPTSNDYVGLEIAPANGILQWINFVSTGLGWLADQIQGFALPDGVAVPQDSDGLYIVRYFSSGTAGSATEVEFVLTDVPNGELNHKRARILNHTAVGLDALGLAIDLLPVVDDTITTACLQDSLISVYEDTSLSIELTNSPTSEVRTATEIAVNMMREFGVCFVSRGFVHSASGLSWISDVWDVFSVPLNVIATGGQITERYLFLFNATTPLESVLVQVGSPIDGDDELPTVPTMVTATPMSTDEIELQWNESTDNDDVAEYVVYRDNLNVGTTVDLVFRDFDLDLSTTYCYEVEAFDYVGNGSGRSAPAVCATTMSNDDTTPPSIPQNVQAVASGIGQISVSWSQSTDDSGAVAGYEVFRSNELVATVAETTVVDMGLAAETEYCYTVRALDLSGNRSDESAPPACATTQVEARFAVTGWTVVAAGDPGIPGDGILIGDDVECGDTVCWAGEEPAVKLLRPEADGFTVSLYMTNIFDAIPTFDFLGSPLGRCNFGPGAFYEGRSTAPPINGVSGESFSYSRATLEQIAADLRQNRPEYCAAVSETDVYLYQIRANSRGNSAVDGIFIGTGQDIFPEPPAQESGWASFEEGDAGVPGDGLTVAGTPRHTIQSPLLPLGSTADGLTLSIYGASPDTFDEIVVGYSGYPACSYTLPLSGGLLNDAPPYTGVAGKFYAINRQFFAQFAGDVAAADPAQCADISADESYFASFVLGGTPRELDAAYVASGFVVFP